MDIMVTWNRTVEYIWPVWIDLPDKNDKHHEYDEY